MLPNINNKKELLDYLENYETSILDKKKRGVVFTPLKSVIFILSKLSTDVWNNPNLRWLDPCAGIGIFPIYIFFRLMNELICIEDIEERKKHIIEKMIYMIEINKEYCELIRFFFISKKYKINLFEGSYVDLTTLNNIDIFSSQIKYDIIIGNPPYQKENTKNPEKLSSKPLYHLFVTKSLELLKENGYLNFIHPVSWRRKSKEIRIIKELINYHIIYIYTTNNYEPFSLCAPYINIYLLQKKKYNTKNITKYETIYNKIKYEGLVHIKNNLDFLPFLLSKETLTVLEKIINSKGKKLNIKHEVKFNTAKKNIRTEKNNEYFIKNLHNNHINKGKIIRYSNKKHPSHDKLKIIMNFKGGYKNLNPVIDDGSMGITDNCMYICVDKDNKDIVLDFLNSDIIYFVLKITNYNFGTNHKNEFHILNLLTIPENNNYNKFYNFTNKEIKFIQSLNN